MSFVGPRPNVERDVKLYTEIEKKLLNVKPGITDFSSIVFSDEGDILSKAVIPDLKYNQVIRPVEKQVRTSLSKKEIFLWTSILYF